MSEERELAPWKRLEELADAGDKQQIRAEAEAIGVREMARAVSRLNVDEQATVIRALDPEDAADLIEELADAQAVDIISSLSAEDAAPILNEMESDESADVLSQLKDAHAEDILSEMDPESAEDARLLTSYAADVAGGLMVTEYLAYSTNFKTEQVIDDLRTNAREYRDYSVQYIYVVSVEDGVLRGVLPLRDLLLTPGDASIADVMIKSPVTVRDTMPLEKLNEFFDEHKYLGVPVTDADGKMLGIVEPEHVEEALANQAQSDFLKTLGIVRGDEFRSMPLFRRSEKRLSWLSVNFFLNMISVAVISTFTDTLSAVIALTAFLPVISDMSGCSGNQAVAVSMRELTLGLLKPFELAHVLAKEASVGVINGLVLGAFLGAVATLYGMNPYLGLVVGGTLALNTVIAVSLGGILPLILKRMKMDPALASGPILTTTTDLCGFFTVLSLATAFLPLLTK